MQPAKGKTPVTANQRSIIVDGGTGHNDCNIGSFRYRESVLTGERR